MGQKNSNIHNLDNINEEGLKKTGKHIDKKGSSKFNWKIILLVSTLVGGMTFGIIKGVPFMRGKLEVPTIPYSITDTIATNSKTTFLDEVLEAKANSAQKPLLDEVLELEMYLDMSKKLEGLNLGSYTDTVLEIEESETFNKDLEDKYQEFVDLSSKVNKDVLSADAIRLHTLAAELNGYKVIVEGKITSDGYRVLEDYGILVVKTAVIDASGISYMSIDNLTIPEKSEAYVVNYTDPVTGKVFVTKVPEISIIRRVMHNVYSAQTKDTTGLTTEEIIIDLTNYLNDVKVATFMRYENNGTLNTTNNYNDVRDIIESPKTK